MTKAMACVGVPMVVALSAAPVAASRWRSLEKSAGVRAHAGIDVGKT